MKKKPYVCPQTEIYAIQEKMPLLLDVSGVKHPGYGEGDDDWGQDAKEHDFDNEESEELNFHNVWEL